jgi:hypothetical protein
MAYNLKIEAVKAKIAGELKKPYGRRQFCFFEQTGEI